MESEVLCEAGSWKNFDELEEELTLDELFILYEKTTERQKRLIEVVGAAMGASPTRALGTGSSSKPGDDVKLQYEGGEITSGGNTLFGYRTKEVSSGE